MVQTRSSHRRAVASQIGTSAVADEATLNERTSPGNQASEKQIQQLIDELGAQKAQERAETSSPGKCVWHRQLHRTRHVYVFQRTHIPMCA